ncbi:MAG: helix-turn-helix domain-containing protein [Bacteroidota bacterium]|nr:helix-turn-helix domain-containing protein [Bacteroidota bacterium]
MKIYIKNMVSERCKIVVKSEIELLGFHCKIVELGEAQITENLSQLQLNRLNEALKETGLELIDDKKSIITEKIKNTIVELIHYSDEQLKINFSDYLSEKLNYNYTYLANIFSEVQGTTIEHFIISHKIEKVKELLVYAGLTLTEISQRLKYSSVAHLSNQFKKITGLTPSNFRKLEHKKLIPLDNV